MTKTEALNKLSEHGIELVIVTERKYSWDQMDLAREDYDVPEDAVVPTKRQYEKIADIVDVDGVCSVMEEYIKSGFLDFWSCSENWSLHFNSQELDRAYWELRLKANMFHLAFWRFPKDL